MKMYITDTPNSLDEAYVIQNLWAHNQQYRDVDIRPLFLTITDDNNQIIAGLVSKTWWGGLEIQYLWVDEKHRTKGFGRHLMLQAEEKALKRHCHMAYVDTFNFQARGFYEKLGYKVYGELGGYAHKYTRFYLAKKLSISSNMK